MLQEYQESVGLNFLLEVQWYAGSLKVLPRSCYIPIQVNCDLLAYLSGYAEIRFD